MLTTSSARCSTTWLGTTTTISMTSWKPTPGWVSARGSSVYVGSDLTRLMRFAGDGREAVLEAHLSAFRRLLGPEGTIFVPTSTTYLCNTDVAFDPDETPSKDMGVFSEYVRTRPDAVRSFHPFWSVAGIGPHAEHVLGSVSRHGYGHGSAWQKFVDLNVLAVNVGKSPHYSLSVIHHIETVMGVPTVTPRSLFTPSCATGKCHGNRSTSASYIGIAISSETRTSRFWTTSSGAAR